nr:PREDICTED: aminoacyl tRNA synthase complex-interacting multifunctional protein 1-like isoform X3 [Bemisia tabaci]
MLTLQNIICSFSMLILGLHSLNVDERKPAPDHNEVAVMKLIHLIRGDSNESIATASPQSSTTKPRMVSKRRVDFSRLDVRIGKIIDVQKITHNLYEEEIDVGEVVSKTVISRLVDHISMEDLENRKVVVLCNLKPWEMRGYISEGMLLCAYADNKVEVLEPPIGSRPGDRVTVAGYKGTADEVLNPKQKIFEKVSPDLRVNEDGVACYKGTPLEVLGKGFIKTETLRNVSIV